MAKVAKEGPWSTRPSSGAATRESLGAIEDYYACLQRTGCAVDIWRTTYVHPLDGPDAIVEWFKATALKPYLDSLAVEEHAAYLALYEAEIAKAYPSQPDGKVLLRFPRLFFVARRM
jgi:trans-aconitate 2-methyltransferase